MRLGYKVGKPPWPVVPCIVDLVTFGLNQAAGFDSLNIVFDMLFPGEDCFFAAAFGNLFNLFLISFGVTGALLLEFCREVAL